MYTIFEDQYRKYLKEIVNTGKISTSRNGQTISLFGKQFTVNLQQECPILMGRKIFYRGILGELQAFLEGPKTKQQFNNYGCNYWDKFADSKGKLNIDYGNIWQDFEGVNQLKEVVKSLKQNPHSRRHLITGWHPKHIAKGVIPSCHYSYQWYVRDNYLNMIWVQRSVDMMIGLPSDVLLATFLNYLMAETTGYKPGELIFQLGDCHIYQNHLQGLDKYFESVPFKPVLNKPQIILKLGTTLFNFKAKDITISYYDNYSKYIDTINFPLNV